MIILVPVRLGIDSIDKGYVSMLSQFVFPSEFLTFFFAVSADQTDPLNEANVGFCGKATLLFSLAVAKPFIF